MLQRFVDFIKKEKLFATGNQLLVAVSGGVDSVVLCQLCKEAGFDFSIAHCHFGLRATESDRDAAFVKSFAEKLGVPFFIKRFDTKQFAEDHKSSIQVAARELRYHWFVELLQEHKNLNWLLTAHHADDQVETALMNFCKGTGISGLRGMLPKRDRILRPLLFATRQEILDYAIANKLTWVDDTSNEETKYTRNFFRHEVLPAVEKIFPKAKENMANTVAHLAEVELLYNESIERYKKSLLEYKESEVHIPVLKLQKTPALRTVIFEIIKTYNFTAQQAGEVEKLLVAESGKYIVSKTHRVLRNRKWLIIAPLTTEEQSQILIDETSDLVTFGQQKIKLEKKSVDQIKTDGDSGKALIDTKHLVYPLILRKWKAGDYFYPLGMPRKKKLARFFIDQKLSLNDKENVWVIESNKRIVWLVGMRIDDRFKITTSTKDVLQLTTSSL